MMAKCVLSHGSHNMRSSSVTGIGLDLEDKLYELKEQNTILKREAHNANYQVKCLNTKLTRLLNEKKRLVRGGQTSREVEMEELIFNINLKLENLMRENEKLHHNTLLLRTQLQPRGSNKQTRPASSFSNVKPRVDTGLGRNKNKYNTLSRAKSVSMSNLTPRVTFGPSPSYHLNDRSKDTHNRPQLQFRGLDATSVDEISLKLLNEAREEIETLEEVVANQQCYIDSYQITQSTNQKKVITKSSHGNKNGNYSDLDRDTTPIAIESSSKMSNGRIKCVVKSEQTQTDNDTTMNNQIGHRNDQVGEMMKNYLRNLEKELKRAREEMSDIQDQLIAAKMNTIRIDELNRKIRSLEKENAILQETLTTASSEQFGDQQEKSLTILQQSLKHYQIQISSVERDKKVIEEELSTQREEVRKGIEENFELRSMLNQAKKQIEEFQSSLSITRANSSNQCNHHDLTNQLINLEQERNGFLNEFVEVKQIIELFQSSIGDSELKD